MTPVTSSTKKHTKNRLTLSLAALSILLTLSMPLMTVGAPTSLGFIPNSGTFTVGDSNIAIAVVVNAEQAINVAEVTINYPTATLEVVSLSKSGSSFSFWVVEPTYSNGAGTISFAGGLPSPGIKGNSVKILTVTFKAKAAGSARLTMSGAKVLANDGFGTNVLTSTGTATLTINKPGVPPPPPPKESMRPAPRITSSTHPDDNLWYSSRDIEASWTAGSGVRGYNVVFDQVNTTVPREVSQGLGTTFRATAESDGQRYLHVRAQYDGGWSGTSHFTFNIDTTPPEPFILEVDRAAPSSSTVSVVFSATDATSGIDRYELKRGESSFEPVTSPANVVGLSPGEHTVTVRAIDKAGNATEAVATFTVSALPPLIFRLLTDDTHLFRQGDDLPVLISGTPLRLRGFAPANHILKVVVRSDERIFEFPVADIVDPKPIEPAPPGTTAWRLDLDVPFAPGEHEVHVSTIDENGQESAEAPVIKFRVVTNVARVGKIYFPFQSILAILEVLVLVLIAGLVIILVLYLRTRRKLLRESVRRIK